MSDDIEAIASWMLLPDTNKAVINVLLDDCIAPADYIATLKVINVIMSEDQP